MTDRSPNTRTPLPTSQPAPRRPGRQGRSFLRRLTRLAGGVAALGLAAWLALALLVNPDRMAASLAASLTHATGREVTITGPAHLAFGLEPSFSVEGVSFANPPGASRPAALTVARVTARLSLISLLTGSPEAASLDLEQPDLLVERLGDGTLNWGREAVRRAPLIPNAPGSADSSPATLTLPLTVIAARGGRIGYRLGSGAVLGLDLDTMRIAADGRDAPITLAASGSAGGQPVSITGNFGALARLVTRPLRGVSGPWPVEIIARAPTASISIRGGLQRPEQGRGVNLRIIAEAQDASAILAAFGNPLGGGASPASAAKALHFDARISEGNDGALQAEQLSLTAGAADLSALVPGLSVQDVSISAPGPGQTAQATVNGQYRGDALNLTLTVQQPDLMAASAPLPVTLGLAVAGANIEAHGTVPPSASLGGMDLQVSARIPDLTALSGLLAVDLPALRDVTASAHLTDAGFKLTGTVLRDLSVQSSAGNFTGELNIDWSPRWHVTGKVDGSNVVLADLWPQAPLPPPGAVPAAPAATAAMPPAAPPEPGAPQPAAAVPADTPATARAIPDIALPVAGLRAADIDLDVTATDARIGASLWRDVQTHVTLQDGRLALNPLRASAAEGAVAGAASLDAANDPPHAALTLRAPAISASTLASLFGSADQAQGTAQLDLRLTGSGASTRLLAATLAGHAGLSMVDGRISPDLFSGILAAAANLPGLPLGVGGDGSGLRCLAARMDFAAGIGTLRAFALDHAKLRLAATGEADFGAETLDFALRPRLRLGGTEIAAPMRLSGFFTAPNFTLDPVDATGRVGITIGGPPPGETAADGPSCVNALAVARDGQPGPLPADLSALPAQAAGAPPAAGALAPNTPPPAGKPIKKPVDLLRALLGGGH